MGPKKKKRVTRNYDKQSTLQIDGAPFATAEHSESFPDGRLATKVICDVVSKWLSQGELMAFTWGQKIISVVLLR